MQDPLYNPDEDEPVVSGAADDNYISPAEAKARWEWIHPWGLPEEPKPIHLEPPVHFVPPPDMPDFLIPAGAVVPPTRLGLGFRQRRR